MTQDSDPDTTAASDSTDSSARVIALLSTAPVLCPQWCGLMRAVLEHCSATGIKFTNANLSNHQEVVDLMIMSNETVTV